MSLRHTPAVLLQTIDQRLVADVLSPANSSPLLAGSRTRLLRRHTRCIVACVTLMYGSPAKCKDRPLPVFEEQK